MDRREYPPGLFSGEIRIVLFLLTLEVFFDVGEISLSDEGDHVFGRLDPKVVSLIVGVRTMPSVLDVHLLI